MRKEKVTVPVVDLRKFPRKWYYIVEYAGNRYQVGVMPYQQDEPVPDSLKCMVEHDSQGDVVSIKQDFAPLLAARYRQGELYDFVIEDDYSNTSTPHYKVADGSGFWFKLYDGRKHNFSRGEKVRCRVTSVNGISVKLEAVERLANSSSPIISLDELREGAGAERIDLLREFLKGAPGVDRAFAEMEKNDYRWIFDMIDAAWAVIISRCRTDIQTVKQAVHAFNHVLLYLLEDCEYLNTLTPHERQEGQQHLSSMTDRSEDLLQAIRMVEDSTAQAFISEVLGKMESSGYLYRPERKLRMMMYVFALSKESMDKNMDKLLDVIHHGRQESWKAEPFRSAFIDQLELYIESNHQQLDSLAGAETADDLHSIEKMLQALAIQQLLVKNADERPNQVINLARLYRYFTLLSRFEQTRMLDNALTTLRSRQWRAPEYQWEETVRIDSMTTRLMAFVGRNSSRLQFETPNGVLSVGEGSMLLTKDSAKAGSLAIPAELGLWSGINVALPRPVPAALRQPRTVRDYKMLWAEIERNFFLDDAPVAVEPEVKRRPMEGQRVTAIIDGIDNDSQSEQRFHCTIIDPEFAGEGWIGIRQITNMTRRADLSCFRNEEGRPFLLQMDVTKADGNELEFTMRPWLCEMFAEVIEPGETVNAVVTYNNRGMCVAFSEYGYSVLVDSRGTNLQCSDEIEVEITNVEPDGQKIYGRVAKHSGIPVGYRSAVNALMMTASDEKALEVAEELNTSDSGDTLTDDEMLTTDEMLELMLLVGRKGDIEQDLVKRFNYHSFAGMIARLLGRHEDADYFRRRCSVIEVLDDFATNGQIDPEKLNVVTTDDPDSLTSTTDGRKLLLLSMLDRTDCNDKLWQACAGQDNDVIATLARLVLAYNLLDGFKMADERARLRREIYQLLGLRRDVQPMQIENGTEGQLVEFKTSAIYPPGPRVRYDVKAQTGEIVEKIVGMLNADGGRIYIGVSDEGYIRGLAPDMAFFNTRDRFELNIRNAIDFHCGFIPNGNEHIQTSWAEFGDKEVYIIDVKPVTDPVTYDGVYYQRQGTSNRYVPSDQTAAFLAARRGQPAVAETKALEAPKAAEQTKAVEPMQVKVAAPKQESAIATTGSRPNVLHDGYDGYIPVSAYLYFNPSDSMLVSSEDLWTEDDYALTLALTDAEMNGELLLIYQSGHVAVVPTRLAVKDFESGPRQLRKNDPLVFAAPVMPDQGLILYAQDESGNVVKQAFKPESLPRVKMLRGQGERLIKDTTPLWAELIPSDNLTGFSGIMRNIQKVKTDWKADVTDITAPRLRLNVNIV